MHLFLSPMAAINFSFTMFMWVNARANNGKNSDISYKSCFNNARRQETRCSIKFIDIIGEAVTVYQQI